MTQKNFANTFAANRVVKGFVMAAAYKLENGIRINAVSPTLFKNSPKYLKGCMF